MNYMKQVAEMLGLEWDEEKQKSNEFILNIDNAKYECVLGNYGISTTDKIYQKSFRWLVSLLNGDATIIKKPWKPKLGDVFFVPNISTNRLYESDTWLDYDEDIFRFDNNLIYRTKEEAIAEAERILQLRKEADK